jgi:hypothetical protein
VKEESVEVETVTARGIELPTVKIVTEGGIVVINQADYDPTKHKLFVEKKEGSK